MSSYQSMRVSRITIQVHVLQLDTTENVMTRLWITAKGALFVMVQPVAQRSAGDAYKVYAAKSKVTIAVGKYGVFSFAGHSHEVSGPIESGSLDIDAADLSRSHVSLAIATASLKVSGA